MAIRGLGYWGNSNHTAVGAQSAWAVEIGTGNMVDGPESLTNFPAATKKVSYKIATESEFIGASGTPPSTVNDHNRDLSKSGVMAEELISAWRTKNPSGGTDLHSFFGSHTSYVADLGNASFRTQFNANVIAFAGRWGVTDQYFDNMVGYIDGMTNENVIPQGYSSNANWRATAAIPFINGLSAALRTAGVKSIMSLSDYFDAALGENVFSEHDGSARKRFWTEVAAAGSKPDAVFWEDFLQNPTDSSVYQLGEDAFNHRWLSNLGRMDDAHALGYDFHGLVYDNGGNAAKFVWASFLLAADLSRGDTLWVSPAGCFSDSQFFLNLGGAAPTARAHVGNLYYRAYPNYTVIVNPSTSSDTQMIGGVSRTVPALSPLFVENTVPWIATPILDSGASGQHPPTGWASPSDTGAPALFTSVGGHNKPDAANWASMYRSDVPVWLTGQTFVAGSDDVNELWFRVQPASIGTAVLNGYRLKWVGDGVDHLIQLWVRGPGFDDLLAGVDVGGNTLGDVIGVDIDPVTPNIFKVYKNDILVMTHDITADTNKVTTAGRMNMTIDSATVTGFSGYGGGARSLSGNARSRHEGSKNLNNNHN